jgi:hypothetical protein
VEKIMFDSPMERCAVCGQMVTLAQTFTECQRRHSCATDQPCPLRKYFSGDDGSLDPQLQKPSSD